MRFICKKCEYQSGHRNCIPALDYLINLEGGGVRRSWETGPNKDEYGLEGKCPECSSDQFEVM